MTAPADHIPLASIRYSGEDPQPYELIDGSRRATPTFREACAYKPRPEFTHVPVSPSALLCAFRDEYMAAEVNGSYDLGEWAEKRLGEHLAVATREARLFRRFLALCANVLPRPYAEYEQRWGLSRAA